MTKSAENKISYEEAYQKLESIVTRMEEEEPALDELVSLYEKGNTLLKICQKRLDEASLRLKQVEEGEEITLRDFQPEEK